MSMLRLLGERTLKLIENIVSSDVTPVRSAAMYYKTEPFFKDTSNYSHTNNWEIVKSIEILTSMGFSIDLIDRDNSSWSPKKKYDLFLGLGVGNSGKNFARYAKLSGASARVLLSMGPQPDISNELVVGRYRMFHERTGHYAPPMRTVTDVIGDKFLEIMSQTDYILNIGEPDNQSYKSYEKYGKKMLNFFPAISPKVSFSSEWKEIRSRKKFLCFAGNGFICKGVDLVTEAFLRNPDMELHICGPAESSYFEYYGPKILASKNIKYHGFIEPGGENFNSLASQCSYVVFHSSAEGCCTSVATAMKAGLVPIINPWTGINVENCGIVMQETGDIIDVIESSIKEAFSFSDSQYNHLLHATLDKSKLFCQQSYIDSYTEAISQIVKGI